MKFVWMLVARYIFASRGDRIFGFVTLFSVIGIAIGVAAINIVQAAQNGVITQTLDQARRGVPDLSVRLVGGGALAEDSALLVQLTALLDVKSVQPFVEGQAAISWNGRTEPMMLRGISPAQFDSILGQVEDDSIRTVVQWPLVVPASGQRRLGLLLGDQVDVISADGEATALGWLPRSRTFTVVGVHQQGGATPTMFSPLDQAQLYLRLKNQWSGLALTTETGAIDLDAIKRRVQDVFTDRGDDIVLETWQDINVVQADVFQVMKRVMAIVLALIMLIAGFNILASQLMLVREKRASIAVFRTMGASKMRLVVAFILIGLMIGLGGVTLGLVLTGLFAVAIPAFGLSIPVLFLTGDLAVIAAIAVGICFLSTIYPAIRAAAVDPAIALRDA